MTERAEKHEGAKLLREIVEGLGDQSRGCYGLPEGPWAAYMDNYTVRTDRTFIGEQETIAICSTGDHASICAAHIARCSPDNILKIAEYVESLKAGQVDKADAWDAATAIPPKAKARIAELEKNGALLRSLLRTSLHAVNWSYAEAQSEWQGLDGQCAKLNDKRMNWEKEVHAALSKEQTDG